MSIQNNIAGVLTLTSPLHCAGGSVESTTLTVKQPLITKNGTSTIPYFPANDLRGRLRRKAAAILVEHLVKNDGKLSVELLSGLTCGAVTAIGENDMSIEEVLRARSNVYMGVFGGGTRLMRSGIKVHDAIPFLEETLAAGVVPDFGLDLPMYYTKSDSTPKAMQGYQLVHKHQTIRIDDVYRVSNLTLIERGLENALQEVSEHQVDILGQNAKRKEDKALNKKTTLANMMAAEAIAIGTQLHFRIDLEDHLTDAQKGLVLLAVRDLCNEQALGGMVRHGWGRFKADLGGVFNGNNFDDNGSPNPVIALNKETGLYELQGLAKVYAENAIDEINKLTIEDMWLFFKSNKTEKAAA